ncbi:MAG TPA: N-6 DNA methylase, partial [Gemmatimonadaceae bacterium]
MLTLRAAASLLARADSLANLAPIAAAIGCVELPAPLDSNSIRALGIDSAIETAHIAAGPGALRTLMLEVCAGFGLRELLPRLASRLSTRAPHVLWLLLVVQRDDSDIAIAAWSGDRRPPRVAALLADRARLVDSDAETLRALAAVATTNGAPVRDLLVHSRWVEVLGREALSIRFYRALERSVSEMAASSEVGSDDTRSELALLNASRLLFLAFLEAKGWLDGNPAFLAHQFEQCSARGGGFHARVSRPLFFGTLNTPVRKRARAARAFGRIPFLNGGLFSRTPLERRHRALSFSDDAFGTLIYDVFGRFRFTAREEVTSWSEAAVDPEMLGRAFESLMASRERRHTGAFYTPFSLVERVAERGIDALELRDRTSLERATILDPACGSGAFLVYTLERVARLLAEAGDARDVSTIRRDVLTRSIFGVDINPTAVWLCELRLWLSVVIESEVRDPMSIEPLPNLDRNIRVGNALGAGAFDAQVSHNAQLRTIRERYVRAVGIRKASLARMLDRAERTRALETVDAELL